MSFTNHLFYFSSFLLLMFFSSSCSSSEKMQAENVQNFMASTQSQELPTEASYIIKTGDEIEILVWEQSNFNTVTTVSSLGNIAIPLIGEVKASGLTQSEFKQELTQRLSKYIRGEINLTVSIRNNDNMLISVFGMVTRPDNYPIINEASIFQVLSMAGGPSEEANLRSVRIYRKNNNPHYTTLDLTKYLDNGQINSAAQIYPGDVVYVPRKENAVREVSGFLRDVVILFGIFRVIN